MYVSPVLFFLFDFDIILTVVSVIARHKLVTQLSPSTIAALTYFETLQR